MPGPDTSLRLERRQYLSFQGVNCSNRQKSYMASSKDDEDVSGLTLALSKLGLASPPGTKHDNFYAPHNEAFYSKYKYCPLDRKRRHIRLLKVFPEEKTHAEHLVDHPRWKTTLAERTPIGLSSGNTFSSGGPLLSHGAAISQKLLACEVIDGVPLSACTGQYLALSYAAGDPEKTASILVDGVVFNAFAQLVHALRCAVRYWQRKDASPDGYFLFWVDQVCINQSNPGERGHQVMMMRDIYSHCATTLVCLSITDEIIMVKDVWGLWEEEKHNGLEWLTNMKGSTSLVDVFWDNCSQDGPETPRLASFLTFLRSPWWTRSWVYQEFVCSPEVHFLFGEDGAPWETISACLNSALETWCDVWKSRLASKSHQGFIRAKQQEYNEKRAQELSEARERNETTRHRPRMGRQFKVEVETRVGDLVKQFTAPDVQKSMSTVAAMMDGRSQCGSQEGDLRVLLRHARNFRASDTRDKVYAFVGLARDDYGFEPSYSHENTAVHVHSDAARRILERDGDLTYVLEQAFVGRRDLGFLLPSWVPDWNCHEDRRVLLELQQHTDKLDNGGNSPQASTTVDSSNDKKSDVDFQENDNKRPSLRVKGRRIVTLGRECKKISPNLRRFETDSGVAVYTPVTARPKDEIWSLSGCEWLVFLQHEKEDQYCFGGFVVVRGFEDKITSEEAADEVFLI
ncbi:heterokaryon incompatibility protein-domain-containing protein [Dactylonectria estremocensis]|uniref:Heterokaryon incompatibility protein-domain-containing protein n=1 Tax=Dactylonectria estremocensis TaxID=1079267 RepID=A0A9P9EVR7_9HYPO|nr:heterokaryon incompatibility protein-domain-containing protein [Dactylonectria estremocensis]